MANLLGSFEKYSKLAELPTLIRQQRKYAALLVDKNGNKVVELEKAVRAQIDALLVACGLKKGDGVVCNGYQVVHRERIGNLALNEDVFVERLFQEHKVAREATRALLTACSERGATALFCEVDPAPGAKVRRPAA